MDLIAARRFSQHANGFGALRLIFAAMVIVAHTPEMVDGNRSREVLTQIFGSISFGEFAVDCFFVISGYLITASWLKKPNIEDYLRKRIARIFPGFLVCFAICFLVVAPLGGVPDAWKVAANNPLQPFKLDMPPVPGAFNGLPYPSLNGSMWTISYEFRCYLLVILLGCLGLLRSARLVLAAVAILIGLTFVVPTDYAPPHGGSLTGTIDRTLRLSAVFLIGSLFLLWQDRIRYTAKGIIFAGFALGGSLLISPLAHFGVAIFGGYLIFAAAGRTSGILTKINNRNDVSYGLYLYAWPIEILLIWYYPGLSLLTYGSLTLILSYGAGWISWVLVEKPALKMVGRIPCLSALRQRRTVFFPG